MNPQSHDSSTWTTYLKIGGRTEPVDPDAFRACMRHDDYPRASAYDPVWTHLNEMGPSVLWLTEAPVEPDAASDFRAPEKTHIPHPGWGCSSRRPRR